MYVDVMQYSDAGVVASLYFPQQNKGTKLFGIKFVHLLIGRYGRAGMGGGIVN